MTLNIRKSALTFVALATIATLAAACGSKKSDTNNTDQLPAEKGTGGAANLACNGTNSDPVSANSNLTLTVHTVVQPISGTTFPNLPNTHVAVYDVATGTTSGGAAVTTSSTALGLITLKDSTRYAFAVTHAPSGSVTYVPTYQFNTLTPVAGTSSSSVINLRMIDSTLYSAFIGLINLSASDVAGKTQVAAATTDCDGDSMKNVVVDGLPTCKSGTGFPCVAYFNGGAPSPNGIATDASGQFIVAGVTPGTPFTIHLKGVVTAGATAVEVGKLTINGKADTVALGTTEPLAP